MSCFVVDTAVTALDPVPVGRVIEDGALWDSTGQLVAQSRQLALVRPPAAQTT